MFMDRLMEAILFISLKMHMNYRFLFGFKKQSLNLKMLHSANFRSTLKVVLKGVNSYPPTSLASSISVSGIVRIASFSCK